MQAGRAVSEWGSADRATVGERIGDQPNTHLKKSGSGFCFFFFLHIIWLVGS